MERDEVGEPTRLLDRRGGHQHFLRDRLAKLRGVLEVGDEIAHERLRLEVRALGLLDHLDAHLQIRVGRQVLDDADALDALDECLRGAVGSFSSCSTVTTQPTS